MIKQRILVVDDNKEVVRLMRAYLEKAGYGVLVAYDGGTAVYFNFKIATGDSTMQDSL